MSGCIGGDSDLSARGRKYAGELGRFIKEQNIPNLRVWTSWMKRTIQTSRDIDAPQERWRALNELDAVSLQAITKFFSVFFFMLAPAKLCICICIYPGHLRRTHL